MVEIEFSVFSESGDSVPETELPSGDDALRALIPDFSGVAGVLTLRSAGSDDTVFADTLRILIDRLCLSGLAALLSKGKSLIDFFDHEETAVLRIEGTEITFSGDQIAMRTLPLADYVTAQKACGERYIALARRYWKSDPGALARFERSLENSQENNA